jgi:plasmid stabilization system protein ParE
MSKYVLGAGAESDLNEIWEYIAEDSPDAADRWLEKQFDAFDDLARSPRIGHSRNDLTPHPVLFWPVGEYLTKRGSCLNTVDSTYCGFRAQSR